MTDSLLEKLTHTIKGTFKPNEPLKNHTTIKIGGPAQFWIEPQDLNDLINLYKFSKQYNIPIFTIGAGSNLIIKDDGIKGICVNLNSSAFAFQFVGDSRASADARRSFSGGQNFIRAGGGLPLVSLTKFALNKGLSGCEFLIGIPGTVGGALIMNAGAWNKTIGDLVTKITALDSDGNIKTLDKVDMDFSYRKSNLDAYLILEAVFKLNIQAKDVIKTAMEKFLKEKKQTQELKLPSAGCIFKNPDGTQKTAGRLIEESGLKAKRIGDAMVSTRHANFIVNLGRATCKDVSALIEVIQNKVEKDHNIWLEPEVKII